MSRYGLFWLGLLLLAGGGLVVWMSLLAHDGAASPHRDDSEILNLAAGVPAPGRAWTFEAGERGAILASPLVAGDRIYVPLIRDTAAGPAGVVVCLDRRTGKPVWSFDNGGQMRQTFSSPCLASGRLYVGEGMHEDFHCKLYCLDAATGHKRWDFPTAGHIESSPCVVDGRVYFGAGDDGVYCLDAATGRKRWRHAGGIHVDTSPAVVGQRLYAGSGTSVSYRTTEVFALDTRDGREVWHVPADLPVWGAPTVDQGQVFIGLGNGRLLVHPEHPAGALLCLNAQTGKQLWRWRGSEAVFDRPVVDGDSVYFGARDGFCYGLDRHDGQVRWRIDLGSPLFAALRRSDDRVYALTSAGRLCRLDTHRGKVDWSMKLAGDAYSQPRAISTPAIVFGERAVWIYAGLELRNPAGSRALLYAVRDPRWPGREAS